jgi:hypothetical protein
VAAFADLDDCLYTLLAVSSACQCTIVNHIRLGNREAEALSLESILTLVDKKLIEEPDNDKYQDLATVLQCLRAGMHNACIRAYDVHVCVSTHVRAHTRTRMTHDTHTHTYT